MPLMPKLCSMRRLMINFSFRFNPQSQALKREVDSGTLGEIYFGRTVWRRCQGIPKLGGWFGKKELSGGGSLIDFGVHRLDLALWLMGYPEPEWAMGATYDPIAKRLAEEAGIDYSVEDIAVALIRFKNGASRIVEASWASHIAEKELMTTRILGSTAGLMQRNIAQGYEFEAELYLERGGSLFDMRLSSTSPKTASSMEHLVDAIYESADTGKLVRIG